MTIRTETETREYEVTAAMDTRTGQLLSADEVRRDATVGRMVGWLESKGQIPLKVMCNGFSQN